MEWMKIERKWNEMAVRLQAANGRAVLVDREVTDRAAPEASVSVTEVDVKTDDKAALSSMA